jgi:hypothetical protein
MDELTDIQILETVLGGVMLKDMTALTFFGWLAGKLNNVPITNDGNLNELRTAIAHPPFMPRVADETKIKYVRKLITLGISI